MTYIRDTSLIKSGEEFTVISKELVKTLKRMCVHLFVFFSVHDEMEKTFVILIFLFLILTCVYRILVSVNHSLNLYLNATLFLLYTSHRNTSHNTSLVV